MGVTVCYADCSSTGEEVNEEAADDYQPILPGPSSLIQGGSVFLSDRHKFLPLLLRYHAPLGTPELPGGASLAYGVRVLEEICALLGLKLLT